MPVDSTLINIFYVALTILAIVFIIFLVFIAFAALQLILILKRLRRVAATAQIIAQSALVARNRLKLGILDIAGMILDIFLGKRR